MSARTVFALAACIVAVIGSCATPPHQDAPVAVFLEPVPAIEPPVPEPIAPLPISPEPVTPLPISPEPVTPPPIAPEPATVLSFDPAKVTQEQKTATFADAKALIDKLNAIIQSRDFEAWQAYLTDEYRAYYSDPAVLAKFSEALVLKRDGIVLKSLKDYFLFVVYRSRQNARLDDIDFIDASRVVALTISPKGERLVLYYLERITDMWKIGIGR